MTVLPKHVKDDSVLDVIQFAKSLDVITGNSSGADKERALERMVEAGVKPDAATWTRVIAGYSSGAAKERVLERMVAARVQNRMLKCGQLLLKGTRLAPRRRGCLSGW